MTETFLGVCVAVGCFAFLLGLDVLRCRRARRYLLKVRRELPSLALTTRQIADLQLGICTVGGGRANVAMLGFDHLDDRGVGSLVVVVMNGPVFDQTIGPAIMARFGAMRPVS